MTIAEQIHLANLTRIKLLSSRPNLSFNRLLDRMGCSERDFLTPPRPRLPEGAEAYLLPSNRRLMDLKRAYESLVHPVLEPSQWTRKVVESDVPLQAFRGDCAYVWQRRDLNFPINLLLTAYFLIASGAGDILEQLSEDDYFGACTTQMAARKTLSRDLLDSVSEIWFLERWIHIINSDIRSVIDIGSGYGRIGYRFAHSCPNLERILCADAIAESTFICEYYLSFRGVDDKAAAVPFTAIEEAVERFPPQLAISVHCLDECSLAATTWWIHLLRRHSVQYFMIVVNSAACKGNRLLSCESDGRRLDFGKILTESGYRLLSKEAKYSDPGVQQFGVSPTDYLLFELE